MPVSQKPRKRNRSVSPAADQRFVRSWWQDGFNRYYLVMKYRKLNLTWSQIRGRITGMAPLV